MGLRFLLALPALLLSSVHAHAAQPPQWRNVSPEGGRVVAIAVNDADAREALAFTWYEVFATTDRGATWREAGPSPCASKPNRAVFHSGAYYVGCVGGIWRTRDAGASWEKFSQRAQPERWSYDAPAFSSTAGEAITWGAFGARVTHDDGKTWFDAGNGFDVAVASVGPGSRRAVAIQRQDSSWRLVESAEVGGPWASAGEPRECPFRIFCPKAVVIDPAGTVYLPDGGVYVRRAGERGLRYWAAAELGLPGGDNQVAVDSRGRALTYTESKAALSADGGQSWTPFAFPSTLVRHAALVSDGSVWLAADDGVWRREGDGPWTRSVSGMREVAGAQVRWASADKGKLIGYTFPSGWIRSDDDGQSWTATTVPVSGALIAVPQSNELWLMGAVGAAVSPLYRSRDEGATWELVSASMKTAKGDVFAARPAGADARVWYGSLWRYTGYPSYEVYGLAVSRDGARTWEDLSVPQLSAAQAIVPSPATASLAFARTPSFEWLRTRDEGRTWATVWARAKGAIILVPDEVDAATVYGYSDGAVWVSRDAGDTWSAATLPDTHGQFSIFADPWDAGRLYAIAADGSILESQDRAGSWRRVIVGDDVGAGLTPVTIRRDGAGRAFTSTRASTVSVAHTEPSALVLGSSLWWNPAESGMGLTLTQHASGQLFAVWFAYDEQRRATWYVIPGGAWDGATFTGAMYKTTGTPLGRVFDPGRSSVERVGSMTLAFDSPDSARMSYAFDDGARGEKGIERQLFGAPAKSLDYADRADLWWDAQQPGSGLAVSHQYGNVFAAWYVYDPAGRPQWIVLPDAKQAQLTGEEMLSGGSVFAGTLYTADGPALGAAFDPAAVNVRAIGTARLRFIGEEAWLEYTLSGLLNNTSLVRLTRQPF